MVPLRSINRSWINHRRRECLAVTARGSGRERCGREERQCGAGYGGVTPTQGMTASHVQLTDGHMDLGRRRLSQVGGPRLGQLPMPDLVGVRRLDVVGGGSGSASLAAGLSVAV
jgi:hypothetical protein